MSKIDNDLSHFEGEVLLVYLVNAPEEFAGGIPIKNPVLRDLFGRGFIVGRIPSDLNDWTSGLKTAIAVDQIAHFLEFTDEREYVQRISSTAYPGGLVS